jgi:hypothetical protein
MRGMKREHVLTQISLAIDIIAIAALLVNLKGAL